MSTAAAVPQEHAAMVVRQRDYDGLTMAVAPAEAKRRLQELQAFVADVMVRDVDFGTIPGTPKPTLYQQGAQKLAEIYGFSHRFEPIEATKDWDRNFFYFEYRCVLVSRRNGDTVGEGIGSANSRESKYAWRWMAEADVPHGTDKSTMMKQLKDDWVFASAVPAGVDKKKLRSEERVSKKNGSKYTVYSMGIAKYRVPNPDVADVVNTLQKMACKRAYVHAVIAATRSSGIFTQDLEDLPPEVFGKAEETRSWQSAEPDPEAPQPTQAATKEPKPRGAKAADAPKPAANPEPPAANPEPPATEAQAKLYEVCRNLLEEIDSLANLHRVAHVISGYVQKRQIAKADVAKLHELARTIQARVKAQAAPEPTKDTAPDVAQDKDLADSEPPADVQTVGGERQPWED